MFSWTVTVVEWLERLGYGAKSRRKVVSSRAGFAMLRLENSLCPLSSKWVPFSTKEGLGSERRGMDSAFHLLWPKYSGPTAIRLWNTFTFLCFMSSISINGEGSIWIVSHFSVWGKARHR